MAEVSRPQTSLPMRIMVNLVVAVILVIPLVLVGSGAWLLYQRQLGDKVEAEVLSCEVRVSRRYASQYCTARWTEDGIQRTGRIQASGDQEVGETITATVRDGEIYSRSLALPLVLLGLGLPLCFFPYVVLRDRLRKRRAASAPR
jgi:hypothetical protein